MLTMSQFVISNACSLVADALRLTNNSAAFPDVATNRLFEHLSDFPFEFDSHSNSSKDLLSMAVVMSRMLLMEREYEMRGLNENSTAGEVGPIFIIGLPCSGAGLLHQLMACNPLCRTLHYTIESCDESVAKRMRVPSSTSPSTAALIDNSPCECRNVLMQALHYTILKCLSSNAAQTWALKTSTLLRQFEFHKRYIQLLYFVENPTTQTAEPTTEPTDNGNSEDTQSVEPAKHWVFQDSTHLRSLEIIHKVYPGAKFVWCHRNVKDQLQSVLARQFAHCTTDTTALTATVLAEADNNEISLDTDSDVGDNMDAPSVSSHVTLPKNIKDMLMGSDTGAVVQSALHYRDKVTSDHGSSVFCDVYFDDLLTSPVETVQKIYAHFDLSTMSDDHALVMESWLAVNRREPKQYGLTCTDMGCASDDEVVDCYLRDCEYVKRFFSVDGGVDGGGIGDSDTSCKV